MGSGTSEKSRLKKYVKTLKCSGRIGSDITQPSAAEKLVSLKHDQNYMLLLQQLQFDSTYKCFFLVYVAVGLAVAIARVEKNTTKIL